MRSLRRMTSSRAANLNMKFVVDGTVVSRRNRTFTYEACPVCMRKLVPVLQCVSTSRSKSFCWNCKVELEGREKIICYHLLLAVSDGQFVLQVPLFGSYLNVIFGLAAKQFARLREDADTIGNAVDATIVGKRLRMEFDLKFPIPELRAKQKRREKISLSYLRAQTPSSYPLVPVDVTVVNGLRTTVVGLLHKMERSDVTSATIGGHSLVSHSQMSPSLRSHSQMSPSLMSLLTSTTHSPSSQTITTATLYSMSPSHSTHSPLPVSQGSTSFQPLSPLLHTASTHPTLPTTSTHPTLPTTSTHLTLPTTSTHPMLPSTPTHPTLPSTSTHPMLPTTSTHPPLPTTSTHPLLPTTFTHPPGITPTGPLDTVTSTGQLNAIASPSPLVPTASTHPPVSTTSTHPPVSTTSTHPPVSTTSIKPLLSTTSRPLVSIPSTSPVDPPTTTHPLPSAMSIHQPLQTKQTFHTPSHTKIDQHFSCPPSPGTIISSPHSVHKTHKHHHHLDREHHHPDREHHQPDREHHHPDREHHHPDGEHHHPDREHHHPDREHHHPDGEHHHPDTWSPSLDLEQSVDKCGLFSCCPLYTEQSILVSQDDDNKLLFLSDSTSTEGTTPVGMTTIVSCEHTMWNLQPMELENLEEFTVLHLSMDGYTPGAQTTIHSPSLFTPSPAVAMGNHKVHSDPFTPSPAVAMGNHKAYSDLFTSWRNTTFAEAPTSMTTIQAPLSPDLFPCTPARGTQSKGFSTPVWWMSPDIL